MTAKFYYEYEDDCDKYAIVESDGGYDLGLYYDIPHFWVETFESAQGAVDLLNDLYGRIPQ